MGLSLFGAARATPFACGTVVVHQLLHGIQDLSAIRPRFPGLGSWLAEQA